jgi:dihydrodipicolinate reductase
MSGPKLKILIGGRGNMATAMWSYCVEQNIISSRFNVPADANDIDDWMFENAVGVYFGGNKNTSEKDRKEKLHNFCNFCARNDVPVIMGSTGQDDLVPARLRIPIIIAPNLALPIIKLFNLLPGFVKEMDSLGAEKSLAESHQFGKKAPGTAKKFAEIMKLSSFKSIRDRLVQLAIGVAREFLDGHAYHFLKFEWDGLVLEINTKVNGRKIYAVGAIVVAKATLSKRVSLAPGLHNVEDII